jgi:hypothetical protein
MHRLDSFVDNLKQNSAVKEIDYDTDGYRHKVAFTIGSDGSQSDRPELQDVKWHEISAPYNCWPLSETELRVLVVP